MIYPTNYLYICLPDQSNHNSAIDTLDGHPLQACLIAQIRLIIITIISNCCCKKVQSVSVSRSPSQSDNATIIKCRRHKSAMPPPIVPSDNCPGSVRPCTHSSTNWTHLKTFLECINHRSQPTHLSVVGSAQISGCFSSIICPFFSFSWSEFSMQYCTSSESVANFSPTRSQTDTH